MAKKRFQVEVLTPEGEVFNEEVEMVSTRTEIGQIGVLANHTPLLAWLAPTELRIYRSDDDIVRFAQGEGYIQVGENHALVLVEDATRPEDLDVGKIKEKLAVANQTLSNAQNGSEQERQALRDKRRWEAFLAVSGEE